MGLKRASTCPQFACAIETKMSGPCAITLLITRIESTTVKIEQKASPTWHLFLFVSLIECQIKNFAFDQQVLGTSASSLYRLIATIGSSFAITDSLLVIGKIEERPLGAKKEESDIVIEPSESLSL